MKVFLDTNVWLSARFHPGLCARMLDGMVMAGVQLLLDERVLAEFERISIDKLKVPAELVKASRKFFSHYATILPAANQAAAGIPDEDDAWILAAAMDAGTEWFVTGDKALLQLEGIDRMAIISPREAYKRLRGLP